MRPGRDLRDELPKAFVEKGFVEIRRSKAGIGNTGHRPKCSGFWRVYRCRCKEDGLVHISKLSNRFVKHPLDIVSLGISSLCGSKMWMFKKVDYPLRWLNHPINERNTANESSAFSYKKTSID